MTKTKIEIAEAGRKKIEVLIEDARKKSKHCYIHGSTVTARLLDDLASVAQKYLDGLK